MYIKAKGLNKSNTLTNQKSDLGIIEALNKMEIEENLKNNIENESLPQDNFDTENQIEKNLFNNEENVIENEALNEVLIKKNSSKCAIQLKENIKNPDRLLIITNPNFKENYNINNTGSSKNVENILDSNFTTGKFGNHILDPISNINSENAFTKPNQVINNNFENFQHQIPKIIERITSSNVTEGFIKNKYKIIVDQYCFGSIN